MDSHSLTLLVEIIDSGNLSQAARKLRMTRANVSYHLTQLEKSVGAQLVRRTTRRVEPTEVGLRLYEHGRSIRNEMLAARETIASLEKVGVPNGIVMISPSATSPALSTIDDKGFFFRTSPSDARQGEVMADIVLERGIKNVAVTYTNNDYGKGLADSFANAFKAKGGNVTVVSAHDDGKGDYSAEVAALAAAGGDALAVVGYADQGGAGIIQGALDSGAFETFILPDGMVNQALVDKFGAQLETSFGQNPSAEGDGHDKFAELAKTAGFDGTSAFSGEAYDAAALMLLAMQAAKSSDPKVYKDKVMEIANAPGEKILPGELAKGLELLAAGTDIDYVGATSVELIEPGESSGVYREVDFKGGKLNVVGFR